MTFRTFSLLFLIGFVYSCNQKPEADRCCTFTDLAAEIKVEAGQGALVVNGSTATYFYVFDESGNQVNYQSLNRPLGLDPGKYQIKVNNSAYTVEVKDGFLASCSTGTLIIQGQTADYYYVTDSLDQQLVYSDLGKATSFFPSAVKVKVNNTEVPVEVKLNQVTEIQTGTIVVHGSTNEYYFVLDDQDKQLNYGTLEKPLAFLPGSYPVKVNNTTMKAEVTGGKVTELTTGNILVKGLTEEYYYATDTLGNALNYQSLNKSLAFFPGTFHIKVNNTLMVGNVTEGKTTEFVTGSLMLTGGGTQYYYVLDETGNQLNYNSLNKSLSFFPSEYTVKLGLSTRKATVTAGELTSINAFN